MGDRELPGSVGTGASFSLRLGQTMFSSASLLFMSLGVEFYSYTAFCYLVTIMGLVIPWSFTLALVDGYSILVKCPIHQPGILLIIVVGDWVLSVLTLAAACSTASVVDLLIHSNGSFCRPKFCSRGICFRERTGVPWRYGVYLLRWRVKNLEAWKELSNNGSSHRKTTQSVRKTP